MTVGMGAAGGDDDDKTDRKQCIMIDILSLCAFELWVVRHPRGRGKQVLTLHAYDRFDFAPVDTTG